MKAERTAPQPRRLAILTATTRVSAVTHTQNCGAFADQRNERDSAPPRGRHATNEADCWQGLVGSPGATSGRRCQLYNRFRTRNTSVTKPEHRSRGLEGLFRKKQRRKKARDPETLYRCRFSARGRRDGRSSNDYLGVRRPLRFFLRSAGTLLLFSATILSTGVLSASLLLTRAAAPFMLAMERLLSELGVGVCVLATAIRIRLLPSSLSQLLTLICFPRDDCPDPAALEFLNGLAARVFTRKTPPRFCEPGDRARPVVRVIAFHLTSDRKNS